MLENCKKGKHSLQDIYSDGDEFQETVVRWCYLCGAVVVDYEYDCRIKPGGHTKMRFPKILNLLK